MANLAKFEIYIIQIDKDIIVSKIYMDKLYLLQEISFGYIYNGILLISLFTMV